MDVDLAMAVAAREDGRSSDGAFPAAALGFSDGLRGLQIVLCAPRCQCQGYPVRLAAWEAFASTARMHLRMIPTKVRAAGGKVRSRL
jgi:hypothetical protein